MLTQIEYSLKNTSLLSLCFKLWIGSAFNLHSPWASYKIWIKICRKNAEIIKKSCIRSRAEINSVQHYNCYSRLMKYYIKKLTKILAYRISAKFDRYYITRVYNPILNWNEFHSWNDYTSITASTLESYWECYDKKKDQFIHWE